MSRLHIKRLTEFSLTRAHMTMQRYNSKAFELETSQKRAKTNDNNYNIDDTKKVVFAKGGKQRVKPCPGWRVF